MDAILEMREITKTFPGVKALSNVNLSVKPADNFGVFLYFSVEHKLF